MTTYEALSGTDQVREYNRMVREVNRLRGTSVEREVARFKNHSYGAQRCEKMASSLRAAETSALVVDRESSGSSVTAMEPARDETQHLGVLGPVPQRHEDIVIPATPAGQGTQESSPAATTPGEGGPDEESEMAKKARKKAAQKAVARAKRGGGPTLREITDEFNTLVPRAVKKGIKVKHHTSLFESAEKGLTQLKKLKKALEA